MSWKITKTTDVINEARDNEGLNQGHRNGDKLGRRNGFKKHLVYNILSTVASLLDAGVRETEKEHSRIMYRFLGSGDIQRPYKKLNQLMSD